MADKITKRGIYLYLDDNKVKNDVKSIKAEMFKLQAQQSKLTIGSKKYVAQGRKIKALKGILAEHHQGLRQGASGWDRLSKGVNKYIGIATAAVASFTGAALGIKKLTNAFGEYEERVDNLGALTGLAGEELKWLSDEAKAMSIETTESGVRIKQGATDIVDAFTLMGSAKPELLASKEALAAVTKDAIILSEAAKMDLKPAVEGLANTMNQFDAAASESSKYINVLAAGSKAGAADIPKITTAIVKFGAAAKGANVSVESSVGLIETLAEKGIQGELAGTALKNVLLKLQTGADDTNPALVGINQALETMRDKNLSAAEMVKLFGQENFIAAQILVENADRVQYFTEAVTDTSVALEQAKKNTNNYKAEIAQAKNEVSLAAIEFGERLAPMVLLGTKSFGGFIKALMAAPAWLKENRILIISLVGALLAYNARLIQEAALLVKNKALKLASLAADKLQVITINAKAIAMRAQAVATGKTTMATKRAIVAQKAFNKALMSNPIGLVIAAVTALVAAIQLYDKHNKRARQLEKLKAESTKYLTKVNEKLKATYDEIQKSMGNLNTMYAEDKKNLQDKIKASVQLAKAELANAKAIQKRVAAEASSPKLWESLLAYLEAGTGNVAMYAKTMEKAMNRGQKEAAAFNDHIQEIEASLDNLMQQDQDLSDILNAEALGDAIGTGTIAMLEEKLGKYQTALKHAMVGSEEYLRIQGKIADTQKLMAKYTEETGEAIEKTHDDIIASLEKRFREEVNKLKKARAEGLITEEEYAVKVQMLDIALLKSKRETLKAYGQDYAGITSDILDAEIKLRENLEKAQADYFSVKKENEHEAFKDWEAFLDEQFQAGLDHMDRILEEEALREEERLQLMEQREQVRAELGLQSRREQLEEELALVDEYVQKQILTVQEGEQAKSGLYREYVQGRIDTFLQFAGQMSSAINSLRDAETQHLEDQYNRQMAAAEGNAARQAKIEEEFQADKKKIQKKYADIQFAVTVAEIMANTALAIMQSYAQLGPVAGSVAAALMAVVGGIQLSAATMQRNKVSQLRSGKYNVIGAEDNRPYNNVPLVQSLGTNIVRHPTLVAEEPELVVDAKTLRNVQANTPWALDAILDNRVPQRASGNYAAVDNAPAASNTGAQAEQSNMMMATLMQMVDRNTAAIEKLDAEISNGIGINYSKFSTQQSKIEASKNRSRIA